MITSHKFRPRLVVMVKEPKPGRVKTRLGDALGMTTAAWWFRHQSARLLRRVRTPKWDVILAVSPDVAGMNSRVWPTHIPRMAQGSGDLGDRMGRLFRTAPMGPMCVIGADIPGVTAGHIEAAFQSLGSNDAVFGPATDGGYWLVGLKRMAPVPRGLFAGVRWSTQHALADTVATIPGLRIGYMAQLSDVDTVHDL